MPKKLFLFTTVMSRMKRTFENTFPEPYASFVFFSGLYFCFSKACHQIFFDLP